MIIQKISTETDKIQTLRMIQSRWPEKNRSYLYFFVRENQEYCLECLDGDQVVGVLLARKTNKKNKTWIEIQIIIVLDGKRRKGIGSLLLAELEKICQKERVKFLFLNSGEDDLADGSFFFYLANGFKIVGSVRNPAESLLYFQKDL